MRAAAVWVISAGLLTLATVVPAAGQSTRDGLRAFVKKDYATSMKQFRPAAERGDKMAQFYVALMLMDGLGVQSDPVEAVRMARRSANQRHHGGIYLVGRAYAEGRGVPQNYVQAHMWMNIAASMADTDATRAYLADFRDRIASTMSSGQLQEAQMLAEQWQPKTENAQ